MVIFTMGTRGDVQPYIFLAQALQKAGCAVSIGTHPCWANLVAQHNIPFVPIGPDIDIEHEAALIRKKVKNPLFAMLKTMQFVFNIIQNSSGDIYEACKNKSLVIVSHSQMGATEAEALNIKTVNVTLQTEMLGQPYKKKSALDKLVAFFINKQTVKPYNKIRKLYSLPPLTSLDEGMSPYLNLIPVSRHIVQPNPYWAKQNQIVGYWYNDAPYTPDKELAAFLKSGDKPVILSLGAMSFESEADIAKLDIFVHTFAKLGLRAVIQGFNKTSASYALPKTMMYVGSVPHSWLFRQGYCVIHHCGFGTTASALLYGIPSIPVPHILDQFAFANQIYNLNAGVAPIKASKLTVPALVEALNNLQDNYEEIHASVTGLSHQLQQEEGLRQAVELILNV